MELVIVLSILLQIYFHRLSKIVLFSVVKVNWIVSNLLLVNYMTTNLGFQLKLALNK